MTTPGSWTRWPTSWPARSMRPRARRWRCAHRRNRRRPVRPRGRLGDRLPEPLRPAGTEADESVLSFATRRMGGEAARRLVGAMVAGIHAGDPAMLSMPAAFPELAAVEGAHGSLTPGPGGGG